MLDMRMAEEEVCTATASSETEDEVVATVETEDGASVGGPRGYR